ALPSLPRPIFMCPTLWGVWTLWGLRILGRLHLCRLGAALSSPSNPTAWARYPSTLSCSGVLMASAIALAPSPALSLSAETAKKCHILTLERYPRPKSWAAHKPGDPAVARQREAFYRACIAKEAASAR